MEWSFFMYVATLSGLVAISIVVVEIIFLIYNMTSRDHVFKGLCDLMGWIFLYYVTTLPYFMAIDLVVVVT